jgi:hypothetical protein
LRLCFFAREVLRKTPPDADELEFLMDVLCDDFDLEFLKHMTPDELQGLEDEMRLAAMHGRRFFELQNSAGANTEDASAAVHMCMELACAARGERCSRAGGASSSGGSGGGSGSTQQQQQQQQQQQPPQQQQQQQLPPPQQQQHSAKRLRVT